jgi:cob(I)alamin adenosyltransferase
MNEPADTPPEHPSTGRDHAQPRREAPPMPARVHADSLVLVNTGHGKGKSTAAFGTAIRALARDWPVAVVQFIKSGDWRTGEEQILRQLGADWWAMGDGFSWESSDLDASQARALAAWDHTCALLGAGDHRMLVLDEITYPINWGWIDLDEVLTTITGRVPTTSVICTGRQAPDALVEIADTVTEMRSVKHAFDRGVRARRGIDY